MGIVEKELAEFELEQNQECRIEYNRGGVIHLHIGAVRIDMTEQEFSEFAETVLKAQKELHKKKK